VLAQKKGFSLLLGTLIKGMDEGHLVDGGLINVRKL